MNERMDPKKLHIAMCYFPQQFWDEEHLKQEIIETSRRVPEGVTSICADLSKGRKTEVDTISGSVVRAAAKVGVQVPAHEFLVNMVHAMENRGKEDIV